MAQTNTQTRHKKQPMALRRSCSRVLMILLTVVVAGACQEWSQPPAEKGTTPPGHPRGAPGESYALRDLDTINVFNGNLNFALPLVSVGRQREAGATVMFSIRGPKVIHQG